ncbi:hypothetical protein AVEN_143296-1 [Araneus ventricosus]|uniref:Uncharacterized protein n=1 Tax=Araneus ventricosus TaxID=182803 RepID=A0A4Y2ADQ1_ARAVE|nr:hypothetical protein AVEN_143296-1 [Araneus ventricosus]
MGGKLSCFPKRKKYGYFEDFYSCEIEMASQQNVSSDDAIIFDLATAEPSAIELKDSNDCLVLETPEDQNLENRDYAQTLEHLDFVQTEINIPDTPDEIYITQTVVMKKNEETTTAYVVSDLPYTILDHKDSDTAYLLHHQQFLKKIHKSKLIDSSKLLLEWQNALQSKMIEKQKSKWMKIAESKDFKTLPLAKQQELRQSWERKLCSVPLQ